jgi:signal transduction histidine kinase
VDPAFARLVSLACHDLRTPLATVNGFAKTLERNGKLAPPADRYLEMIIAAAGQIDELLDELSVAARIEGGRYEPALRGIDTAQLAQGCVARLGAERVLVAGEGAPVQVDVAAVERGLSALVQATLRHGGLEQVDVRLHGEELEIEPVTPASAPVVLGEDLRDLGAAVAVRVIEANGGSVGLEGRVLRIRLPSAPSGNAV